jgi:hypothetical protein
LYWFVSSFHAFFFWVTSARIHFTSLRSNTVSSRGNKARSCVIAWYSYSFALATSFFASMAVVWPCQTTRGSKKQHPLSLSLRCHQC